MLTSVIVRLDGDDIAGQMNRMREWLDRHGIEPDKFEIQRMDADGAVYRVDFRVAGEAAAFVEEFSGAVVG
jgi:glycine cleavage system regulatory protein